MTIDHSKRFFGLHFDIHANTSDTALGADTDEANIAQLLERVRPDFVQYDSKGHPGYAGFPTQVGWPAPGLQKDALSLWRKVTREHGVDLYIHYSGVFDTVALKHRPDWACVNADGTTHEDMTSTFGSYVDELLIPQLQEAVANYDLDGVWVDGDCWAVRWDHSPQALAAWKAASGQEQAPTPEDAQWVEWKQFQRRQFVHYLTRWNDALHRFKPDLAITSNWMYSLHAPGAMEVELDYISGDYDPIFSFDKARAEARFFASRGLPWDLMAWGFNFEPPRTLHTFKPVIQIQQEAAVVLMQGGGFQVYFVPTRSGHIADEIIVTSAQVAEFCRARQSVCFRSTPVPQVALLHSADTHEVRSDVPYLPWGQTELQGALHALLENHYSVEIFAEHQLQSRLAEYPLVVIANAGVMTEPFRAALSDYVAQGGSLLLLGEACRFFEKELGVKLTEGMEKEDAFVQCEAGIYCSDSVWPRVELTGATAHAYRFPSADTRGAGEVAATSHAWGKGHIAAIYGEVASHYFVNHEPPLRALIGELAEVLFPAPLVTVDAPPVVDVALRRTADGKLSVHLLNGIGANRCAPQWHTDFIPTLGPIEVRLKLEKEPQRVWLAPDGEELLWTWQDGELQVTVEQLHLHCVVVVE